MPWLGVRYPSVRVTRITTPPRVLSVVHTVINQCISTRIVLKVKVKFVILQALFHFHKIFPPRVLVIFYFHTTIISWVLTQTEVKLKVIFAVLASVLTA